jgi:hypothetical protein
MKILLGHGNSSFFGATWLRVKPNHSKGYRSRLNSMIRG